MKTIKVFIVLAVIFSCTVDRHEPKDSLLWKITGNGLERPSYLYGTVHLMDERVFSFDSTVYEKILACDALSGELLFEGAGSKIDPNDLFMDDTLLVDLYENEKDYNRVKTYLKDNLGIFSLACDSMRPIYTSTLLSMMDTKMDKALPLDAYFQQYAKEQGKLTLGIETMEEQQDALNSISLQEQATILLEGIEMEDSLGSESMTEYLLQAYLKQDLVTLDSMMETGTTVETFQVNLLDNRNVIMADRIEGFIRAQPTFNTLGAGHLKGKNGVIQLLRAKGYTLEPVHFNFKSSP